MNLTTFDKPGDIQIRILLFATSMVRHYLVVQVFNIQSFLLKPSTVCNHIAAYNTFPWDQSVVSVFGRRKYVFFLRTMRNTDVSCSSGKAQLKKKIIFGVSSSSKCQV